MNMRSSLALMLLLVTAACSGPGQEPDEEEPLFPFELQPAMKADTNIPANLACVGTADPHGGGADIDWPIEFVNAPVPFGTPPPPPQAIVERIDPETDATLGAAGTTSLTVPANARVTLKITPTTPEHVTTYLPNTITPAAAPASPQSLSVASERLKMLWGGLLWCEFTEGLGVMRIVDCDGDPVRNAFLDSANDGRGADLITVAFSVDSFDPDQFWTHGSGELFVMDCRSGLEGTSTGEIRWSAAAYVYDGTEAQGVPTTRIAETSARFRPGAGTILTLDPLRREEPGG